MFNGVYHGKRVLLTGHTGFKGSRLAIWLHRLGAEVSGLALPPPTSPALFDLAEVGELIDDELCDIRDCDAVSKRIKSVRPEIVFHLAAQPIVRESHDDPKRTFDTNVSGTVNVLEALRGKDFVKAVVVVTSDKCYARGDANASFDENDALGGDDPYSASKAAAEIVCCAYRESFFQAADVRLATARAGNAIGGGDWGTDRIIPDAVRALSADRPVCVRHPNATRPWQHVVEALGGYLRLGQCLLEGDRHSSAWNFGPAEDSERSVRELIETFLHAYGSGTWEDLSGNDDAAPKEAIALRLSTKKAHERLGWRNIWSFEEAVSRTARWHRRHSDGADARSLCIEELDAYAKALDV